MWVSKPRSDRYSWSPAVAARNASSNDAVCGESSCSTTPRCAASSPTCSMARPCTSMPSAPWGATLRAPARCSSCAKAAGCGRADAHPAGGVTIDELFDRALLDQPTATDHHQLVGHQRHLRQQMAADEHRLALSGQVGQDVADPADALGVEPVAGLVEDHGVRIAEQHAGDPEPLSHAERVRLHLAVGDLAQTDHADALVDPGLGDAVRRGEPPQVVPAAASRVHVARVEQRADLEQRPLDVGVRLAGKRRGAGLSPIEPDHAPHRRALPRTVRTEEAR